MDCMATGLISSTCEVDMEMGLLWAKPALTYAGYFTTALVLGLPVINTFFKVCQMKAVGDLRGEPLVASLLSYICSFFFSLIENNWKFNDLAWLNLIGLFFYVIYLGLFLKYANPADRQATIVKWIPALGAYILLIVAAGLLDRSKLAVKWMYTLAGMASACTPFGLILFVLEKNVQNLPDWLSSTVGLVHYSVWLSLSLIPKPDYFDVVQNGSGVVCSFLLLVLLIIWTIQALRVAAVGLHQPLLPSQHVTIQVAQNAAINGAEDNVNLANNDEVDHNDDAQDGGINGAEDNVNLANNDEVDHNDDAQDGGINGAEDNVNLANNDEVDHNDDAQDGGINGAEDNVNLANNVEVDHNDDAQEGGINEAEDNVNLANNVQVEPNDGADNQGQAGANHVEADANDLQIGGNQQQEPIHPQLPEAGRTASAPATPVRAVAIIRSSSV